MDPTATLDNLDQTEIIHQLEVLRAREAALRVLLRAVRARDRRAARTATPPSGQEVASDR